MFYAVIHLNDRDREEDALLALAAAGVLDAVVLEATSAAERMAEGVPLFAGFRADLTSRHRYALVVSALVPDEEAAERVTAELARAGLDFESGEDGRLILLPVARLYGPEE